MKERGEGRKGRRGVRRRREAEGERVTHFPTQLTFGSSSYLNTIRGTEANHISSSDGDIVGLSWGQEDISRRSVSLIHHRPCQVSDCDIVASDVSIV